MRLQGVIRYLNWLIGLSLLVFLGAIWWWAWRPLARTSGRIAAPVSASASVTRDDLGVPHIRAASVDDALFLQGYVTAQDRLWQMDASRRFASGQLSEIIGPATLDADREARMLRMRRMAEEHARILPPSDRRWLAAYARGVNHFIETHRSAFPVEFALLDYEPRPWSIADSLAIGLQMYRNLTASYKRDVTRAAMLNGGNRDLVAQLMPARSGIEVQPGSNAWVVSGAHTASGKPLLANDPHLEFGNPSTWYMVHLQAPGFNVAGVSLPGTPAVIIGHNDRIAWGVTNLHADVQDLYVEQFDSGTGRYVFQDKLEQARLEKELIAVKGAAPVEFANWITRHGPLITTAGQQALALRWTAAMPGLLQFPFVEINAARNWEEFRTALERFGGPGQNFVYADIDGNIGYQATGALPVRKNFDGAVPLDGSSGRFEWAGFVPFDELPSAFNPPDGRIVTANQNPFPADWEYRVNGEFDSGYRARQIRDLLAARKGWKPEEMLAVQKDVYSPFLHGLMRDVVAAADRAKPQDEGVRGAIDLLRNWNGQMEKDLAAPLLASLVYEELRGVIVDRAAGRAAEWQSSFAPAVVERLVREQPATWFGNWDQVLLKAVSDALEAGRKLQGRDYRRWEHGAYLALELKHPVISQVPWIGSYFTIGPVKMSGSSTSVKQTTRRVGPSMRFVADLSDWNKSLNNITLGQSGQILSSHYRDQWDAYWSGRSFPMQWGDLAGDVLTVEPAP